jgi:hypothetical protein
LHRAQIERTTEVLKSLALLSTEALKALLLINGGAIVALLAYAGTAPPLLREAVARSLWGAVLLFAGGVLFAALSLCLSYWTQLRFFNRRVRDEGHLFALASGMVKDDDADRQGNTLEPYRVMLVTAQVCGILSITGFLAGSVAAALALRAGVLAFF